MSGIDIIYPNLATSITASSEDSEYPATNLVNAYPNQPWKAVSGVSYVTLEFHSYIPVGAVVGIALHNFFYNMEIQVSAYLYPSGVAPIFSGTVPTAATRLGSAVPISDGALFTAALSGKTVKIVISFYAGGSSQIYCGAIRFGVANQFDLTGDIKYGRKRRDIQVELNDSTVDTIKEIDSLRTYSGTVATTTSSLKDFDYLCNLLRNEPVSIQIADDTVFGRFDDIVDGTYQDVSFAPANFSFTEVK